MGRASRAHHIKWAEWFYKNPSDKQQDLVGTAQFHRECIAEYDNVLAVLTEIDSFTKKLDLVWEAVRDLP